VSTLNKIKEDVGELLIGGFLGTNLSSSMKRRLESGEMGGVILFHRNLPGVAQFPHDQVPEGATVDIDAFCSLMETLHGLDTVSPLWFSIDQEGGRVQRIREPATVWPPMMSFANIPEEKSISLAEEAGGAMGVELKALGFNLNFSPVLDIHTNQANPVIGRRAFGESPQKVVALALAFARGLKKAGIIACGKHFPGHGDTNVDSHEALPVLAHSIERLNSVELLPFIAAANARLPMIMTAHILFSAMDDSAPATLSKKVVSDLLRQEIGFEGIIVSDDLDMHAISKQYGLGEAAVLAIEAGCDLLLACQEEQSAIEIFEALIKEASKNDTFLERVHESAHRIRQLKVDGCQPRKKEFSPSEIRTVLGSVAHRALADTIRISGGDLGYF